MYRPGLSRFTSGLLAACYCVLVMAVPSPATLGPLTILSNNDLSGNSTSSSDRAILLEQIVTAAQAQDACAAIGESLWHQSDENAQLSRHPSNLLAFKVYDRTLDLTQLLWVAITGPNHCRAISASGKLQVVDCKRPLPAICTQSAPVSTAEFANSSTPFRIVQAVGNQELIGYRDAVSWRFLGIRYAQQPKRFTYSTLYDAGKGRVEALQPGAQCVQTGNPGSSEDCLFLNVWTPRLPSKQISRKPKLKATMVWIHGGAFTGGTGSDPTADGGNMASRGDVVVVTINYRLSTLGFLALDNGRTNGNFGLQDMITALQWVKKNIEAFGGDPNRVTVFGQSAGAAAVWALVGSPEAKGLFSAAIPQSNLAGSNYATTYSLYYTIAEEVEQVANDVLNATGCAINDPLPCLRAYDAHALVNLPEVARYLVVDGKYLRSKRLGVTGSSYVSKVPVMAGFMRDDGAAFIGYPTNGNVTAALEADTFDSSLIVGSGDFPVPRGINATLNVFNVTSRVATDSEFRCLDQAAAYSATKHGVLQDIYFYEFNRSYQTPGFDPNAPVCDAPTTKQRPAGDPNLEYFKCHSGELYFEFGNVLRMGLPDRDGLDVPFSRVIVDRWSSFARTHDPNPLSEYLRARGYLGTLDRVQKAQRWDPVNPNKPALQQLQWQSNQIPFKEASQCAKLGYPLNFFETL